MYEDETEVLGILNHAIDSGITYLDTAYAYGDGKSETRVGKVMATRRKDVWLATKIPDRTRDEFMRRLEGSLNRTTGPDTASFAKPLPGLASGLPTSPNPSVVSRRVGEAELYGTGIDGKP